MKNRDKKISAVRESIRDIDRDNLRLDRLLEKVDEMANPAESKKSYEEGKEELCERKDVLKEVIKDINDLYELRRIMNGK